VNTTKSIQPALPIFNKEDMPGHWIFARIGDICQSVHKVNPKEQPEIEFDYIDISGIDNKKLRIAKTKRYVGHDAPSRARQLVHAGDMVFSTVRTYLKNMARVSPNLDGQIASTGFCVLRTIEPEYSSYLFYYLQYEPFLNELAKFQRGTSYPAVRDSDVRAQYIPVPPKSEAMDIVAEIEKQFSRLDEAVTSLKRANANLKRYKAAVLKAAVEGKLTEEWRKQHPEVEPASVLLKRILAERRRKWVEAELAKMRSKGKEPKDDSWKEKYKEPDSPDIEGLPTFPASWSWVTLPQLGELNRGKSKHRPRNDPILFGGPYPFVQTGDIRHARGLLKVYSQTYSQNGLDQSRMWPKGTLCITIAANIADTAILDFDACFPDSIVGFLPNTELIVTLFIDYFIRTAKKDLERFAPATAQKNINLSILKQVVVPLPPTEEQMKIISEIQRRLSISDYAQQELEASFYRVERLQQAILKKAFLGLLCSSAA